MRDRANTRESVTGQISVDKERDTKEKNEFFPPQDMDRKKMPFNQYERELKIYAMQSLFIFVYTTQHTVISL